MPAGCTRAGGRCCALWPDCSLGRTWYGEGRSALLFVPSVVARMERNIIINTRHADFEGLTVGPETPVWWDRRLFRRP